MVLLVVTLQRLIVWLIGLMRMFLLVRLRCLVIGMSRRNRRRIVRKRRNVIMLLAFIFLLLKLVVVVRFSRSILPHSLRSRVLLAFRLLPLFLLIMVIRK